MSVREVVDEIADILSWSPEDVQRAVGDEVSHPGSHVRDAWNESAPRTDMQIEEFYSTTTSYIFDLMVESARAVRQAWREAVVGAIERFWVGARQARVLDYGAGVGTDTLYFAERCRAAYYYDLPGATSDFAAKRFARRGAPIARVSNTSSYHAEFDAIVSFEVLEHLVDPAAHLDEMVRLTRPGGLLFLTESFGLVDENYPSHLPQHLALEGKLDDMMCERGCRPLGLLEGRIHVYVKGPQVTIIVPVYDAFQHVRRLLTSINETNPGYPVRWLFMNDASPDPRISPLLHEFAAHSEGQYEVVDAAQNRGFVATCNDAMSRAGHDDVILLNSDTIVYDGWVRKLLAAAYSSPEIGTVTPLSNNGSCYSMFQHVMSANALSQMLEEANHGLQDIPVGVGFCLFVKRELLDRVGPFDPIFGKGYGEETDLCLRASALGYRHVLALNVFVYHAGGASMIGASVVRKGETTIEAHEKIVATRYPHFTASVHEFIASGVIQAAERVLAPQYVKSESSRRLSIAIVVHDDLFATVVGGTTYHIRDLMRDLERDFVYYIITPESAGIRVVGYVDGVTYSQSLAPGKDGYRQILEDLNPSVTHVHHLMHFSDEFVEALTRWRGQKVFTIHDYFGICPQYNLLNYRQVYCGVPQPSECDPCASRLFGSGYGTPSGQRARYQRLIDAVSIVVAPSRSALEVFRRGVTIPDDKVRVIPHPMGAEWNGTNAHHWFAPTTNELPSILSIAEQDNGISAQPQGQRNLTPPAVPEGGASDQADASSNAAHVQDVRRRRALLNDARLRIGFIGYNSPHKGPSLVQGIVTTCSSDPIAFVMFGDVGKSVATNPNVITVGRYSREQIVPLIKSLAIDVMVVTSNWPETYCYTASEAWLAGVPIIVGPYGAPAERVKESGAGLLLADQRVPTYVAAIRSLMTDADTLARLKEAARNVELPTDYGIYRDLYTSLQAAPQPTRFFSSVSVQKPTVGFVSAEAPDIAAEIPVIAKLVSMRKRIFPVGSARERVYFWMHNRVSRVYAGGITR